MFDLNILKRSLVFSASAVLYVVAVATVMRYVEEIFGSEGDSSVAPVAFLLLLVVSAATMGALIFGKPVMLYIDGKKREAVAMLACTICTLAFFTVLVFAFMAASRA